MTTKVNMDCSQVRPLLSEALDQRLSQGESVAIRSHLLACHGCRSRFDDLRRLHIWTHELPRPAPSADFQSELLRRIQAGEGTPAAVLRGPVSIAHRLRFFASGAVTAAALLISAWLVHDGLRQAPSGDASVAADTALGTPMPVTAASLAEQVLARSAASLETLQHDAPGIRDLPPNRASEKLVERSRDAYYGLKLVRHLHPRVLELPEPVAREISGIEAALEQAFELGRMGQRSRADVERAIDGILQARISREMFDQVRIRPQQQPVDIGDMLPSEWSHDPRRVREFTLALKNLFEQPVHGFRLRLRAGHGGELELESGGVMFFRQPLIQWSDADGRRIFRVQVPEAPGR
jgi:hypothetical protein